MYRSRVPPDVLHHLEDKLRAMTQAMLSGNRVEVAHTYADNALLTDLKDFRVEGREAIDQHWAELSPSIDWQLRPLETGGDVEMPHQRLHSVARMVFKGQVTVDERYCFVVWKRQADSDYRIHVDIYHPLKFGPSE
jgi:ketosteroid isomerase-like protein